VKHLRRYGTSLKFNNQQPTPTRNYCTVLPDKPFGLSAYGGFPVKSSIIVQPRDQMSDAVEAPFNSITSGATASQSEPVRYVDAV
jgi:hypothetical protein